MASFTITKCLYPRNPPHLKPLSFLPPHILKETCQQAHRRDHALLLMLWVTWRMWTVEVGSKGVRRKVSVQFLIEPVLVVIVEVDVCLCDTVQCWPVSSLPSQEMENGHNVVKTRGPLTVASLRRTRRASTSACRQTTQCSGQPHTPSSTLTSSLAMSNPTSSGREPHT